MKKNIYHLSAGLIVLLVNTQPNFAQYPDWINYTSGKYVQAIAADSNRLWIATTGGLVSRDLATGSTYYYNKANSPLPQNDVNELDTDENGNVWMGIMGYGLVRFDGSNWDFFTPNNSPLPSPYIYCIETDAQSNVWIGTSAGMAKFDGSNWTIYTSTASGLPSNYVQAIAFDPNGTQWIGTNLGVSFFNGLSWTTYNSSNSSLPDNLVTNILPQDSLLWIGTFYGLVKFDGVTWSVFDTTNSNIPDNNVYAIAIDGNATKWIATANGIASFDGVTWTLFNTSNTSIASDFTRDLVVDTGGNKWIATSPLWSPNGSIGGGVSKFDGNTWQTIDPSNSSLPENVVNSVLIDKQWNKWLATYNGVTRFDGTNWINMSAVNNNLPDRNVLTIAIDSIGNQWFGTYTGLARYNGSTVTFHDTANSLLPHRKVVELTADPLSGIWIGTFGGGMAYFDGNNNWTIYNKSNSPLPCDSVRVITIDGSGNKWIGTEGGGMAKLDGNGNWTIYNSLNSALPGDYVTEIAIDSADVKWIGTYLFNGGLTRFDGTNWTTWNQNNSTMPTYDIKTVGFDRQGNILLSAGGCNFYCAMPIGLIVFDKNSNWTVYNVANSGIPNNDVITTALDSNGDVWLATAAGGAVFKPGPVPASVNETEHVNPGLLCYPNPAIYSSSVYITLPARSTDFILSVADETGRVILNENVPPGAGTISFNTGALSPGSYMCTVYSNSDRKIIGIGKLVVLKQ